ncbi:hypothetical protein FG93_04403 [Bosea sp. LC85]|uniref:hypothetical protein n=1 Tax=Bosea sp. LC85 TaxID=1502851 RepID=UPI0004E434C2|nr:hypothetical protein [Bosea sp. LC85]KFC66473.1 hypothetical protein FG93_04403 [Bosea sp. LC85]
MSETGLLKSGWTYRLEDVVLHAICFLVFGPSVVLFLLGCLEGIKSLYQEGWASASAVLLNLPAIMTSVLLALAWLTAGPVMAISGAIVSAVSRILPDERLLAVAAFGIAAVIGVVLMPLFDQSGSRLVLSWGIAEAVLVGGCAGVLMTRATGFLRRWRTRQLDASGKVS